MFKKQTKSFTLIEVLVGIVVVGILSSFIIVSISSFVDDANDTKRKKDLDSIASSLLAYKTLTGSYPIEASDCNIGEESCL
ncbi:MAG: prepilin-type N-terminal cleavage/methylation domain-containing protein, partial [Candidatus Pacebacteria bacterium]|nr:prepilin-type N-terminal cleavage/methylation domain-containing protein [Candidatus Paceibacterota bacterium]